VHGTLVIDCEYSTQIEEGWGHGGGEEGRRAGGRGVYINDDLVGEQYLQENSPPLVKWMRVPTEIGRECVRLVER
jgi:hypothetical protein